MANPFYVEPADIMPGLSAAMGGFRSGAEAKLESAKEERKQYGLQKKRQEAAQLFKTGTPQDVGSFVLENPDLAKPMMEAQKSQKVLTEEEDLKSAWDVVSGKVRPEQAGMDRAQTILDRGGDAAHSLALAEDAQAGGDAAMKVAYATVAQLDPAGLKAFQESQGLGAKKTTPATDIDDYVSDAEAQYLLDNPKKKSMPPGERNRARIEFKRVQAKEAAGVKTAVTTAELSARAKLEPAVRTAVDQAAAGVKAQVDAAAGKRSNDLAWNVYDTGMRSLIDALAGTTTGPGMEWMPAVTESAQIANGATAAMAPVLKHMFRASGEGTFTKDDQEILMAMLPGRNDHQATIEAKLASINSIVKAKLGMSGVPAPQPAPQQAAQQQAQPAQAQPITPQQTPQAVTEGTIIKGPSGTLILRNNKWEPYNG